MKKARALTKALGKDGGIYLDQSPYTNPQEFKIHNVVLNRLRSHD